MPGRAAGRPTAARPMLLVQRSVGFVVGVDEDVPHRLEVVPAALDELKMLDGDQGPQVGGAKLRPASVAVGGQGLRAPELRASMRSSDGPSRAASSISSSSPTAAIPASGTHAPHPPVATEQILLHRQPSKLHRVVAVPTLIGGVLRRLSEIRPEHRPQHRLSISDLFVAHRRRPEDQAAILLRHPQCPASSPSMECSA